MAKRLRALTPVVAPSADHWRDPEQREGYLSGLRLAISATDEVASPSCVPLLKDDFTNWREPASLRRSTLT